MGDEARRTIQELEEHLKTLETEEEITALLEGETRVGAIEVIEAALSRIRGSAVTLTAPGNDDRYSIEDLQAAAATLGTTPAGVAGAMRLKGLTSATLDEARAAVKEYNEREV